MTNERCFKDGCYTKCPFECDWKYGRLEGYKGEGVSFNTGGEKGMKKL